MRIILQVYQTRVLPKNGSVVNESIGIKEVRLSIPVDSIASSIVI